MLTVAKLRDLEAMKAKFANLQREIERCAAGADDIAAREGGEAGRFAGYAAVFNEPDLRGEVVRPGAFVKSLVAWCARGKMPPMWMEHGEGEDVGILCNPLEHLAFGEWMSMVEDGRGLSVRFETS